MNQTRKTWKVLIGVIFKNSVVIGKSNLKFQLQFGFENYFG